MHAPGPLETLYLPGTHDEQGPPLLPDAPALHLQSDRLSLPDGESEAKDMPYRWTLLLLQLMSNTFQIRIHCTAQSPGLP